MKSLALCVLLAAAARCASSDYLLPSYITPCDLQKSDFKQCVRGQIEKSLPFFAKGIPELGVASIDPVDLSDILIDGNGLKLTFSDAKMHGLSKISLKDLTVELGEKEENFKILVQGDLSMTAKYKADGKILILPIQGDGDAKIDCRNVGIEISSKLVHVNGEKGEYLKLVTPHYTYDIESTKFDLKNLFNGNKQLAETTLQFANENWRQLMDDLAPPAIKQIVKTIVKVINKFFSRFPISTIIQGYKE